MGRRTGGGRRGQDYRAGTVRICHGGRAMELYVGSEASNILNGTVSCVR